jgi:hypothetical protein
MTTFFLLTVGSLTLAADTGIIIGTVDQPKLVTSITAINRASDKKFAGKLEPATGKFTIADLPLGAKYDLIVDYGGARLEGVNLKTPPADDEQPLTKEDIESLTAKARELNQFEDTVEVLAIRGNSQHAAVFLNKLRTKPFVNSAPGEVVWRVELWHFEKPDETWIKDQDELFLVHYRERLQKSAFEKKAIAFDPHLGGLEVTSAKSEIDLGTIKLPAVQPGIRLRGEGGEP